MSGEPPKIPKGSIVSIWYPFTDFTNEKLRPALVLCDGYLDVTVVYISGELPAKPLSSDLLILPGTPSYINARLREPSVLCIDKVMKIVKDKIEGIQGEADDDLKREVNKKIAQCLMFNDVTP